MIFLFRGVLLDHRVVDLKVPKVAVDPRGDSGVDPKAENIFAALSKNGKQKPFWTGVD